MANSELDRAVLPAVAALKERGVPSPGACLLLGTGLGTLPSTLRDSSITPLYEIPGVPAMWHDVELYAGMLGETAVWLLEEAPADTLGVPGTESNPGLVSPAWQSAFPVWLAAAAGAKLMLHTSSGVSLDESMPVGSICVVSDHINLSGTTPLLGLGQSQLGPMFPDQTRLHHPGLRLRTEHHVQALGAELKTGVAACLSGPALATHAEYQWLAGTPATLALQGAASPWIASAHAGMSLLALCALCDSGNASMRMPEILSAMETVAPLLEDVIGRLAPDLAQVIEELEQEI